MNGHKFYMLVLVIGALLLTAACSTANAIQTPDGQALSEQGNAYMACLQEKDIYCAYELLSPESQRLFDEAQGITHNYVDLESAFKKFSPKISAWKFERAKFSTRGGAIIGSLDGSVEYLNGDQGAVNLELEQDGGTWKVRSSSLESRN